MQLTEKELKVLYAIYKSEYQDSNGEDTIDHYVWSFSIEYSRPLIGTDIKGKVISGIVSSLSKKGLVDSKVGVKMKQ